MRDNTDKVFFVVAMTVMLLLLLHWIPATTVGGWDLRSVDILSQLSDTTWRNPLTENPSATQTTATRSFPHLDDYSSDHSMALFFARLDSLKSRQTMGRPVRIAIFGDSFVEGDIVIGELRELLQSRYGGCGVGWIDAGNEQTALRTTFWADAKGLDEHMAMKHDGYDASRAALSMRYYTINAPVASFTGHGVKAYPHAARWQQATLFLKTNSGVTVSSYDGGRSFERNIQPSQHVQTVSLPVVPAQADSLHKYNPMNISFSVRGRGDIYGVALESADGVIVDNFSMRGESGVKLGRLPAATLREFQALRPYDLIVLQYGANVIDSKTTDADLDWFRRGMGKTLAFLHSAVPDVPVLIVSTPDRGDRRDGEVCTMQSVHLLVGVQQQIAKEHHVAFYNLFEAMGGENSIARLYKKNHCNKDLIHLTISGGKEVAHRILDK